MEDASRGYGLLLHAFGLRTKEIRNQYSAKIKAKVGLKLSVVCGEVITTAVVASRTYLVLLFQIYSTISQDVTLKQVKETLESSDKDYFGKAIELAWKFVTLPNPLIVCQPKYFDPQIHNPEYGHWDKHAKELPLIYIRPVVYRDYEGVVASKGWVASNSQQRHFCVLS